MKLIINDDESRVSLTDPNIMSFAWKQADGRRAITLGARERDVFVELDFVGDDYLIRARAAADDLLKVCREQDQVDIDVLERSLISIIQEAERAEKDVDSAGLSPVDNALVLSHLRFVVSLLNGSLDLLECTQNE